MRKIHPTAIVDPKAKIADDVEIGPYSIIGGDVQIGAGTIVGPHVVIKGCTEIGERNRIFQFSSIGEINQDRKYKGEKTRLRIGDENVIREYVTMQIGTVTGIGITKVGDRNLFMVYSHIAHDCEIGNDCILANCVTLAGHIRIDDGAIVGGLVGVHQFCSVGEMAIVGGCSKIVKDIPPYMMADGRPARVCGINIEGLKRKGIRPEGIREIKAAHKAIFQSKMNVARAIKALRENYPSSEYVKSIVSFVEKSQRGITK